MDLHLVEDIAEVTDDAAGVVRMISALEAYRRFSWIMDAPVLNAAGNYRGIVISAQWKNVYVYRACPVLASFRDVYTLRHKVLSINPKFPCRGAINR